MSRTIRSDSKLHGLPIKQRAKVDVWLFEEGLTYKEVVDGCLREFGLQVSKSSVGRYYERISANRFAKAQREKRMASEPELSPAEAYKELLRRIAVLAWEEMDQPLKDINHKVVVRLVRVLIAARREKHMETRVWVERMKAQNWLAQEVLRHWRREKKKQAHVSYLPIWRGGKVEQRNVARAASNQLNVAESPALKRHECRAPGGGACDLQKQRREKSGSQENPPNHFALDRGRPLVGTLMGKPVPTQS
jgi:hypothetical protein